MDVCVVTILLNTKYRAWYIICKDIIFLIFRYTTIGRDNHDILSSNKDLVSMWTNTLSMREVYQNEDSAKI